jgi:hypothetical protein
VPITVFVVHFPVEKATESLLHHAKVIEEAEIFAIPIVDTFLVSLK